MNLESLDGRTAQPFAGSAFVLDDEPQIGALVCKVLQGLGFQARQFTSPGPFLDGLNTSAPDLVLLDLSLGQSDAVEVIRHLDSRSYDGQVMLISGRDEATLNEISRIGEKRGLAMLPPLKKPFRPADIKARLTCIVHPEGRKGQDSPSTSEPAEINAKTVDALRSNWMELWYQPKIDLKSFSCSGVEALVRARHPKHGIITPDRLLPPAGDPDYHPLTQFVVERAIAD